MSVYSDARPDGVLAASYVADYVCSRGHRFQLRLARDVAAPTAWECRHDATPARLIGADEPDDEPDAGKPVRTPWDMLRERRSIDELETLLQERLALLHTRTEL